MFRRIKAAAVILGFGIALSAGPIGCVPTAQGGGCCRVCTTGKACGDSCISRSDTCHKGAGCACNGR